MTSYPMRESEERPPRLTVSVMIPTRNRPDDLKRTIDSLCRQTVVPIQLVIVDQSTSGPNPETSAQRLAVGPQPVQKIRLDYIYDPSIAGAAAARNRAMEDGVGDIWLFLDDDVVLEPNFIEELLAEYEDTGVNGVSGIITNYGWPPAWVRLWIRIFMLGPFFDERQPIYWRSDRLRTARGIRVYKFTGALMSFRADAIRHLAFDERLIRGARCEDTDFSIRAGANSRLVIAPRARLAHYQSRIGRSRNHWLEGFAECNWFLYYKNWETGPANWCRFQWLKAGCALFAGGASLKRRSLDPCRSLRNGARNARVLLNSVAVPSPSHKQDNVVRTMTLRCGGADAEDQTDDVRSA